MISDIIILYIYSRVLHNIYYIGCMYTFKHIITILDKKILSLGLWHFNAIKSETMCFKSLIDTWIIKLDNNKKNIYIHEGNELYNRLSQIEAPYS